MDDDTAQSTAGLSSGNLVQESGIDVSLLRRQQKIVEALFARPALSFAVFDSECTFIRVNESYARLFGMHVGDFIGHRYSDLFPDDIPAFLETRMLLENAAKTGQSSRFMASPHQFPGQPDAHMAYWDWLLEPVSDDSGATEFLLLTAIDVSELKRAEDELRQSESLYHSVVTAMAEGMVCQSADGRITAVNPAAVKILGRSPQEMLGLTSDSPAWQPIHEDETPFLPDDHPSMVALRTGQPQSNVVMGIRLPDGTLAWISINAQPILFAEDTSPHAVVTTFHDITRHKSAEETQTRLNRALRLLSSCNQILIHAQDEQTLLDDLCRLIVEKGGYLLAWVGYAEEDAQKTVRVMAGCGYEAGYLDTVKISWADNERGQGPTGISIRTGATSVNQDYLTNPKMAPWREAAIRRGYQSSISLPLRNGEMVFGALAIYSAAPYSFNPEEVKLLEEMAEDLAFGICTLRAHVKRRDAEEQLAFLAQHDPLTRLPNRRLLRDRFETAVGNRNHQHGQVAMLFLDLDNFKEINDSLGHAVGDELLVHVVQRLHSRLDCPHTISREGGDEFVVLLPDIRDIDQVSQIAQHMLDSTRSGFEIGSNTLHTSFSIGISIYPNDGTDFETLRKNADIALYRAKDGGRNNYRFFTGQMDIDAKARMQMQINLRSALKNGELLLQYQPQVRIKDGRIVGMEALIRWRRPDGGLIAPNSFIPVAEQSGLIIPIGEWVLEQACRQAVAWRQAGLPDMIMAVNLSATQFKYGNIVDTVADALHKTGLSPALLELELTESILLQDTEASIKILHTLKAIGVKLSIDDFGTGYSSLSYLKRLAVDKLKIDQSFVHDLAEDADDLEIVRAIIQLGHILGLEIIAEGVETEEQLAFLREFGCDQIQGYLFSRPLSAENLPEILDRNIN